MRDHRWILLAAMVGILVVGCNGKLADNGTPPDTTPTPITTVKAPVVGFGRTADAAFEARDAEFDELLASGTLDAADASFEAIFRPLAEIPASVLEPGLADFDEFDWDDEDVACNVTVTPATLRTTGVFMFEQVDAFGMLFLSTLDWFFDPDPGGTPVGSRIYLFLLADRAASIQGTCDAVDGDGKIVYALNLAQGWNSVAFVVTKVDEDGDPIEVRIQNELPTSEAKWFYFGFDMEFPD